MDIKPKDIAFRIKQLCKDKKISIKAVLEECSLNRNFIYDLENRGSVPSIEAFYNLADYFNVSVDYLIGRQNTMNNNELKSDSIDLSKSLSESQRALIKRTLYNLLIDKFKTDTFFDDENLLNALNTNEGDLVYWLTHINSHSLDNKIYKFLDFLGITEENMFDDIKVVISCEHTIRLLNIELAEKTVPPIIVSGKTIFPHLKNISLSNLIKMEDGIVEQISVPDTKTPAEDIVQEVTNRLNTPINTK